MHINYCLIRTILSLDLELILFSRSFWIFFRLLDWWNSIPQVTVDGRPALLTICVKVTFSSINSFISKAIYFILTHIVAWDSLRINQLLLRLPENQSTIVETPWESINYCWDTLRINQLLLRLPENQSTIVETPWESINYCWDALIINQLLLRLPDNQSTIVETPWESINYCWDYLRINQLLLRLPENQSTIVETPWESINALTVFTMVTIQDWHCLEKYRCKDKTR